MTLITTLTLVMIINSNHPITLFLALTFITALLAYKTFIVTKMSLLSYEIILVLLGGLIMLFIYMASLASNKPFETNNTSTLLLVTSVIFLAMKWFTSALSPSEFYTFKINTIMLYPLWVTMVLTYLFITLIAVVKITSTNFGPLRSVCQYPVMHNTYLAKSDIL